MSVGGTLYSLEPPRRAHVNTMTDTIIANLPEAGLRSVMRALMSFHPELTSGLELETEKYLLRTNDSFTGPTAELQKRVRCMLGCGMAFESIAALSALVDHFKTRVERGEPAEADGNDNGDATAASVEGDLIQATTAMERELMTADGSRTLSDYEKHFVQGLISSLQACRSVFARAGRAFPFARGLAALKAMDAEDEAHHANADELGMIELTPFAACGDACARLETFRVGERAVPRLFGGLWQLSGPAWGTAPQAKIVEHFTNYVNWGFTAYDMADHYGDAEIVFGKFRAACSHPEILFASTKYCVFNPVVITPAVVHANVSERCRRLKADKLDLLQFHWQNYHDPQYIEALKLLEIDPRVSNLGLCNFDTEHMEIVLREGVRIQTNQVQFSIIDSRPTVKMAAVCESYGVKLLTYGTLCGGFLADQWLDQPEPEPFSCEMTPSQRKYCEAILTWGSWSLFQTLLRTLSEIGAKHGVSISNVATRWVLDFPYVGAVIVGSRMGISERADDNFAAYGWTLDEEDRDAIEQVLTQSNRDKMIEAMGDCGGEYR
ncbi:aldo keto reductase [Diplodia corticola]|uniref:Aldo keto reductase n=1 Tax=Diplodia corticola TaxID=236234 RepID=A0A1J9S7S5_9PEZI|nr:aldo keto reductase [Diplodia corticola]OJD36543.1 aldo keto reductase [Diplodia corticola]